MTENFYDGLLDWQVFAGFFAGLIVQSNLDNLSYGISWYLITMPLWIGIQLGTQQALRKVFPKKKKEEN